MKHTLYTILVLFVALTALQGCDRDGTLTPVNSGDQNDPENLLIAARATSAPVIDGVGDDAVWQGAETVAINTIVADIPAFAGYGGRQYQVQMKATYDDSFVYFLARYADATLDTDREPWYVEDGVWKQESRWPQFDENGAEVRKGFYEDKFSMMWEASAVEGFDEQGCGVSCHVGLSPFASDKGKSALKYTNNFGEVLDMWHLKYVRSAGSQVPKMDDQYTNFTSTAANGGRHSDPGTGHYSSNKQTIDGKSVPLYMQVSPSSSYFWISPEDITSGVVAKVASINAEGDLVLENGTTISHNDPNYQRDGDFNAPSVYSRVPDGDRADIDAVAKYGGGFWTVEIRRARSTGSQYDVQYDDLEKDYPFGVAVFDNAGIAHGTSGAPAFLRLR
jgi:ethylbenzene dehydrogenase